MKLGNHTIVVLRAGVGATDGWGNPVAGWDDPDETTVPGCSVQPATDPESINGQQSVEDLWEVWVPTSTDVLPTDRIEHAGVTYDVSSGIRVWDFPPLAHKTFQMRRVEAE